MLASKALASFSNVFNLGNTSSDSNLAIADCFNPDFYFLNKIWQLHRQIVNFYYQ